MTRLSSRMTGFFKRGFPVLWFGLVAAALVIVVVAGAVREAPVVLLSPLFMGVLGLVLCKQLLWDLMDEVHDGGDHLLVRNHGHEETIPLSGIINVSLSTLVNPPRVTLRLATPGRFGERLVFTPIVGLRLNPFAPLPQIDDLIVRIDRARR